MEELKFQLLFPKIFNFLNMGRRNFKDFCELDNISGNFCSRFFVFPTACEIQWNPPNSYR